jgi:D-alanyl-lipoteichoic acid acyltransferase DltB (MBOAT superfamily)
MTFTSPVFLAFVLFVAVLCNLSDSTAWRRAVLVAASLLFLFSEAAKPLVLIPLALFVLVGYAAIQMAKRFPTGVIPGVVIATFVALFLWLKRYPFVGFLPALPVTYIMVGASYILFRTLHLVIEVRDQHLAAPSFPDYLLYCLFFPSLLSGPINRFDEFDNDLRSPRPLPPEAAVQVLGRGVLGYTKVAVLGELVHLAQINQAEALHRLLTSPSAPILAVGTGFAAASVLYFVYLYLNFSGYMDMAISIARLFGIVLPENFNRPFRATNFQDLWSRWHVTLSNWFKVYFYNPLLKSLIHRWSSREVAPYLGVLASFVVFLVLGAWHGASWEFMLIGFSLAAGVSANVLYQVEMTKRMGKSRYQALTRNRFYVLLCRSLTMAYFSFTLSPIWLSIGELKRLVAVAGFEGLAAALGLLIALFGALFSLQDWRLMQSIGTFAITRLRLKSDLLQAAAIGFAIFLLVLIVPAVNSPPEFVYKAF